MKLSPRLFALLLVVTATFTTAQQPSPPPPQQFPRFIVKPGSRLGDGEPTSGAKLCVLGEANDCYQMPHRASGDVIYEFGLDPLSERLSVPGGGSWVFFASIFFAGGSGSLERLAVLRYDQHAGIVNLLPFVAVTNQSQREMRVLPQVSAYPILLTADFVWSDGETHYSPHFYTVEAWCFDSKLGRYEKAISYRTEKKYAGLDNGNSIHVLGPERDAHSASS